MAGQGVAKPPVEAFINQDSHRLDCFKHRELAGLDYGDGLLSFNRGEGIDKIFDRFSTLQIINQVLERDARAYKNRGAPHDFGIGMNDTF